MGVEQAVPGEEVPDRTRKRDDGSPAFVPGRF
jgi:hypothetical protein